MVDYRISQGFDFNYFKLVSVSSTTFGSSSDGYTPDVSIWFPTQAVSLISYGLNSSNTVEYSLNGFSVHGELVPGTPSAALVFDNRPISKIWFRIKLGSSGPVDIRSEAWSVR
jgi:hypothetical protein